MSKSSVRCLSVRFSAWCGAQLAPAQAQEEEPQLFLASAERKVEVDT